ncbi:MAG TPA: ABC transporter substrate-binding protein [Chloroflexota bacterium]
MFSGVTRRLFVWTAIIALCMVAALPGSTGSTALASRGGAGTRAMTDVQFILSWLPNVQYAGLWVAQQKGWWAQAGIRMHFTPYSESVHPETDVPTRGGNTFGFQSGAAIVIARDRSVPIQAVYADAQRSVFGLMVLASSNIHSLKNLKGKRVGYKPHELYVPETMLANVGLSRTQWAPRQVGFDPIVLSAGQVDALSCFLINEPIALALKGIKTRTFRAADYGFHFYDNVLFTTTSLMKSNPSLVRRVVTVAARGFAWAHKHPDAAARLTVAHYFPSQTGYSAAQNLRQQMLESETFRQFTRSANGRYDGLMNTATWRESVATLYRYGEIKSKPAAVGMYTNRFNPNA